ncbi:MAG TPA: PEGA domain-containing protein [bacterium]|nr:PEGA domain-containing protein [bacterium]
MRFSGFINIISVITVIACGVYGADIQEEALPHTMTYREIAARIDGLEDSFEETEPDACLSLVEMLRAGLATIRDLDPRNRDRLLTRLDMIEMAVLFTREDRPAAESIAGRIFRRDPAVTLSGSLGSAEMAMWFESIRETYVGLLSILSRPPGSKVYLDDVMFGTTPLDNVFAPAGDHSIRLEKDGYTSWIGRVLIQPGEPATIAADLSRNSATLFVWVSPPETAITIDSVPGSITTQPLPALLYPLALSMGLWPKQMAQPVFIEAVKPGQRFIRFESDCHQSVQYRLNVSIGEFFLPPILLQPAESFVSIQSVPDNRPVFIDGRRWGTTPVVRQSACPGSHYIEVQFESGRHWGRHVELEADREQVFQAHPRPSILFLGCASENAGLAIEAAYGIESWIDASESFTLINRRIAERYRYRPAGASVLELMAKPEFDPGDGNWLSKLSNLTATILETNATLVAIARIQPPDSRQPGSLIFIRTDTIKPDVLPIPPGLPGVTPPDEISSLLSGIPPLSRLRSGLRVTTVDRRILVSEIIPGGPSETSPLQSGDRLLQMDGQRLDHRETFESVLSNPETPEMLRITAQRGNREFDVTIPMMRQPVMLPLDDPRVAYNLILTHIDQASFIGETNRDSTLNAGICHLALDQPREALDTFETLNSLDESGIGRGTVQYLMYLAAQALGDLPLATAYRESAAQATSCTIIHGDGPELHALLQ